MIKRILAGILILCSIALSYGMTDNTTADFAAEKDYVIIV